MKPPLYAGQLISGLRHCKPFSTRLQASPDDLLQQRKLGVADGELADAEEEVGLAWLEAKCGAAPGSVDLVLVLAVVAFSAAQEGRRRAAR